MRCIFEQHGSGLNSCGSICAFLRFPSFSYGHPLEYSTNSDGVVSEAQFTHVNVGITFACLIVFISGKRKILTLVHMGLPHNNGGSH